MEVTQRQTEILNSIIQDYINLAQPIGSEFLDKKHNFRFSPATIRIEMQKLTDKGYLAQPHTSAGRVPTDKGYRFYVDNLRPKSGRGGSSQFEKEIDDFFRFFQDLTKRIAELTSNLALSYFPEEDIFFKEGWDNIFKEPEFENTNLASKFAEMVENMEKEIEEFEDFDFPQIFIGKENLFPGAQEFSTIISKIHLPKKKEGVVAILGPKRMDYNRNVGIINSLNKKWQKKKTQKTK